MHPQLHEQGRKLELMNENETNGNMPHTNIYRTWSSSHLPSAYDEFGKCNHTHCVGGDVL